MRHEFHHLLGSNGTQLQYSEVLERLFLVLLLEVHADTKLRERTSLYLGYCEEERGGKWE